MKKIILTLFVSLVAGTTINAYAVNAAADTVINISKPDSVCIVEDSLGTKVEVYGKDKGPNGYYMYRTNRLSESVMHVQKGVDEQQSLDIDIRYPFAKEDTTRFSNSNLISGGLSFGFINTLSNSNFNTGKSFEFQFVNFLAYCYRFTKNTSLSLGVGFDIKNYKLQNGVRFSRSNNDLVIEPFADSQRGKESSLDINTIMIPLTFTQRFAKDFKFSASAILDWNVYAKASAKYWTSNDDYSCDYYKNIGQRKISCSFMGTLSYSAFGAYFKYSPCSVFTSKSNIDMKSLSFGIILWM